MIKLFFFLVYPRKKRFAVSPPTSFELIHKYIYIIYLLQVIMLCTWVWLSNGIRLILRHFLLMKWWTEVWFQTFNFIISLSNIYIFICWFDLGFLSIMGNGYSFWHPRSLSPSSNAFNSSMLLNILGNNLENDEMYEKRARLIDLGRKLVKSF